MALVVALAADAILSLHAGHVGALVGAVRLDPGAGLAVGGNLHAEVSHALGAGDEDGGVSAGVAAVGGGAPVELEPGTGELADGGLGDRGAGAAGTGALRVGVEGDVLGLTLLDSEGNCGEPAAVNQALGADLVEARARVVGIARGEGGGVVVEGDAGVVDDLHVAAPVVLAAGVARVGDLGDGSALALGAAAEGSVDTAGGTSRGSGGRGRGGRGSRGGKDVLDEGQVALLDGVSAAALVELLVVVGRRVGRHAGEGGRKDDGRGEVHLELSEIVERFVKLVGG